MVCCADEIVAPLRPKAGAQRAPFAAVQVTLVASACVAGLLTVGVSARGAVNKSSPCGHDAVAVAKWAAEPVVPIAGAPSPAVTHPAQCAGDQPPVRISSAAREITCTTVRRAARTRLGGRFGP